MDNAFSHGLTSATAALRYLLIDHKSETSLKCRSASGESRPGFDDVREINETAALNPIDRRRSDCQIHGCICFSKTWTRRRAPTNRKLMRLIWTLLIAY